jgi:hypothetical protein
VYAVEYLYEGEYARYEAVSFECMLIGRTVVEGEVSDLNEVQMTTERLNSETNCLARPPSYAPEQLTSSIRFMIMQYKVKKNILDVQ